jgi:hypothetical protein
MDRKIKEGINDLRTRQIREDENTKLNKKLRAALRNLPTCNDAFYTLYGQPRLQPPTSWPKGLDKNELMKLYRQGYWLAIEDYPTLVTQENLLVPSAYGEVLDTPGASTYPIGFKWYHDPNGNWGLTSVSTAKTRNDRKNEDGEAVKSTLTRDIPKGVATRFTIADDANCPKCGDVFSSAKILELHTCGFDVETKCTNQACPKGAAARLTDTDEAEQEENYPLVVQAPDPRGAQDEQETFFSEVRSGRRSREHVKRFLTRNKLTQNSSPGDAEMPDLEADQATSQSNDRQDSPRPTNFYPKKWKKVIRARKNNNRK